MRALMAGFTFQVTPDPTGAPGASGIQHAIDVIGDCQIVCVNGRGHLVWFSWWRVCRRSGWLGC